MENIHRLKFRWPISIASLMLLLITSTNAAALSCRVVDNPDANGNTISGFEIGNGRGIDTGGFEIGNGREVIEVVNRNGFHSVKFYKDFDYKIDGKITTASGLLAGKTQTNLRLELKKDTEIPELAEFLVNGLKEKVWSVIKVGDLHGLKKDIYDPATRSYGVQIKLHVAKGELLELNLQSSLEGMKEMLAIWNSVKTFSVL